jgi:ABC-type polysaccharide/polyol phosphate export permease
MSAAPEAVRPAYRPARPGPLKSIRQTIADVVSRRRLIMYLVRADLKKHGADTVLGNVWWFLDPLLTMLVYVVLVTIIVRSTEEAYPLFIFCAILPWKWFSSAIGDATTCIVARERIIKQVAFPKIVLPMAACVGGIVSFAFGLIPLFAMLVLLFPNHLSPWVLLIPVVAVPQFLLTLGIGILLSGLTVFYRDVGLLMTHVLRLWFYVSPALYGADKIASLATHHPELVTLFNLNPFAGLFESYRNLIYYGQPPTWDLLGVVMVESLVILVVGVLVFRRIEPSFAKVL